MDSPPRHETTTASQTLDEIRKGGNLLLLTAQQRFGEAKRSLEQGDFMLAHQQAKALAGIIGHLAGAQGALGTLANAYIVKSSEVQAGMILPEMGEIEEIGPCPLCDDEDCENRAITLTSGLSVVLPGGCELAVQPAEEDV